MTEWAGAGAGRRSRRSGHGAGSTKATARAGDVVVKQVRTHVAVVGYGYWGSKHVRVLSTMPDVAVSVVDRDPRRIEDARSHYPYLESVEPDLDAAPLRRARLQRERLVDRQQVGLVDGGDGGRRRQREPAGGQQAGEEGKRTAHAAGVRVSEWIQSR